MSAPSLSTRFTELVGIKYPIVQTGMGWVSGARLTAATAAAGGLGILASATMTLEELRDAIHKVRARTSNPFGVNLLPNQPDAADRIALIVDEGVEVASFAAAPRPEQVSRLSEAGITTIVTVGAKRHAQKVVDLGVSAVIAQGGEGGGHTGSVPTSLLVPEVVDGVADERRLALEIPGFELHLARRWQAQRVPQCGSWSQDHASSDFHATTRAPGCSSSQRP